MRARTLYNEITAPVAQLDRAVASGATGREFESLRAHQIPSSPKKEKSVTHVSGTICYLCVGSLIPLGSQQAHSIELIDRS